MTLKTQLHNDTLTQDHTVNSRRAIELAKKLHPELMSGYVAESDDLFMRETSAPEVMGDIVESCVEIGSNAPLVVPVAAFEGARSGWCFDNVRRKIGVDGGTAVHGWTNWSAPGFWHNAEFHFVWKSPVGGLIDITPKPDGEHIIFAPDGRYDENFDFYLRPGNIRTRSYAHEERKPGVAEKIAEFSERRLVYEKERAMRKGLSISQSVGMSIRGRDRLESFIDAFLENVGRLEGMLKPTPVGMVLKEPRRQREFEKLGTDVNRQRSKLFLMADMQVRGMVPN